MVRDGASRLLTMRYLGHPHPDPLPQAGEGAVLRYPLPCKAPPGGRGRDPRARRVEGRGWLSNMQRPRPEEQPDVSRDRGGRRHPARGFQARFAAARVESTWTLPVRAPSKGVRTGQVGTVRGRRRSGGRRQDRRLPGRSPQPSSARCGRARRRGRRWCTAARPRSPGENPASRVGIPFTRSGARRRARDRAASRPSSKGRGARGGARFEPGELDRPAESHAVQHRCDAEEVVARDHRQPRFDPRVGDGDVVPGYLSAPRRRVTPVEEGSTQTVVGLIW